MEIRSPMPLMKAIPRACLRTAIRTYQLFVSPLMGSRCRYYPCCSNYALDALDTHGCSKGLWLAGKRILRCHPYAQGGHDPVPPAPTSHRKQI